MARLEDFDHLAEDAFSVHEERDSDVDPLFLVELLNCLFLSWVDADE
jgi:hypothetical protein